MNRTFYVARRFHPAYSLLGRRLRQRLGDARHAEAVYLVVVTGLLLALLLAQGVAWTVLRAAITAAPAGPTAVAFWLVQAGSFGLFGLCAVVGFKPGIAVAVASGFLRLEQGTRSLELPFPAITAVRIITAQRFHRHYARYAATQVFISRPPDEVLLFETTGAPVIVGLTPEDRAVLLRALEGHVPPVADVQAARVA